MPIPCVERGLSHVRQHGKYGIVTMSIQAGIEIVPMEWQVARGRVAAVDASLAALLDNYATREPVLLLRLPYGTELSKVQALLSKKLTDTLAAKPLACIVSGAIELGLQGQRTYYPWRLIKPGSGLFTLPSLTYHHLRPNNNVTLSTGVRSLFFLPAISDSYHHNRLMRAFSLRAPIPQTLEQQSQLFQRLLQRTNCEWRSEIILLPKSWSSPISQDYQKLCQQSCLLQEEHVLASEARLIRYLLTEMQQQTGVTGRPEIVDISCYLLSMALGEQLGWAFAEDDSLAPSSQLREIYLNDYGLKDQWPTLIHIDYFSAIKPLYYSLRAPLQIANTGKIPHSLQAVRELSCFLQALQTYMQQSQLLEALSLHDLKLKFTCFHNMRDVLGLVQESENLAASDPSFQNNTDGHLQFAKSGLFLRGCVQVSAMDL